VNTPTRGIGKTVMDALDSTDPLAAPVDAPPLVQAGLYDVGSKRSLWARTEHVLRERSLPTRALTALRGFHDLMVSMTEMAKHETVSIALGKVLEQTGYLRDLREEHSEEAESREQNLLELVSAAREYEQRDESATLGGFVDLLSLLSEADETQGAAKARVWLMTMHAAKGLEFPVVIMPGMEEGLFPHTRARQDEQELEEERRLCYVGITRAQRKLVLTSASRRRVFGEYQGTEPSRFLDEIPPELIERIEAPSWGFGGGGVRRTASPYEMRVNPYARPPGGGRSTAREDEPTYRYEDEDQSAAAMSFKPGLRVRHPQFGVGTILSVEPVDSDFKLQVRFASVGPKTLRAKYARLQPA
jgi:ATP-dependent DNA helicase UvrD/PcrA